MELNAQIIKKGNTNEFAVLPYEEFQKMKEMLENYEDLLLLRNAKSEDHRKKGKSANSILEELSKK
jgi:HPt (histidine-containing phosphotransfer) domain-containing protein